MIDYQFYIFNIYLAVILEENKSNCSSQKFYFWLVIFHTNRKYHIFSHNEFKNEIKNKDDLKNIWKIHDVRWMLFDFFINELLMKKLDRISQLEL